MLLQHYQERWANDFKEIEKVIGEAFIKIDVSIVHVGSTSVPELAAKPIIDIDLVYGPGVALNEVKTRLEKIGYYHNGDQGIKEREVFRRPKLIKKHQILDSINHHLYVCPLHSAEFNQHLLFRDFLINNERERKQYQEIKMEIAEEAKQDGKTYAYLKDVKAGGFIRSIIERAQKGK